jgi:phosphoribosyl 1,2-cyclic phosphodiesterase
VTAPDQPASSRFSVQCLGSGSSGNSFLIEYDNRFILLDCGIVVRTVQRALKERGHLQRDIEAILLTHEHSDHVRAMPQVALPGTQIVSSAGTRRAARIPQENWTQIIEGRPETIAGMTVWSLKVQHDAAEPCGFLIETPAGRATILTDLGAWHQSLLEPLLASDLIVLEANHDEEMLKRGPYPQYLKKRVLSDKGHLSNHHHAEAMADVARQHRTSPVVWLAHLSETNNTPDLAEYTVIDALHRADRELEVMALPRRAPGPIWEAEGDGNVEPWHRHKPAVPASLTSQLGFDFDKA